MVREMISVVIARVCVDIAKLQSAFVLMGVPCWLLLSLCGLPGPLMLIIAGVLLICTSMDGADLSLVLG